MEKTNIKKTLAEVDTKLSAIIDNLNINAFTSDFAYSDMNNALAKAISGVRLAISASDEMFDFEMK